MPPGYCDVPSPPSSYGSPPSLTHSPPTSHYSSHSSSRSSSSSSQTSSYSSASSSASTDSECNARLTPHWPAYRTILERHDFYLDTYRDVKQFYERYWEGRRLEQLCRSRKRANQVQREMDTSPGHPICAMKEDDEDDLCRDAGLPDNLFRGTHRPSGQKIVVKAVHIRSLELSVISYLTSAPVRDDARNHTIPVLSLIPVPSDDLVLIVMEEWSSQLVPQSGVPCTLRGFMSALRQCIEGLAFMHSHRIAHLDISLRNILTDYKGHYAYVDFEMSRHFPVPPANKGSYENPPRVRGCRGTELPPEIERGEPADPFKVDVWALGMLILRACALTSHIAPELSLLTRPMLRPHPAMRPEVRSVLEAFDRMVAGIPAERLDSRRH